MRALALFLIAGCTADPTAGGGEPDTSLFRDFLSDGKFDQAGHPDAVQAALDDVRGWLGQGVEAPA